MKLQNRRAGFTLIELLVVIAIIVVLAGLSAMVASSGLFENYRNVGANDRVTGWLITSKAWAQREKAPRGVRFVIVGGECREAQYIEVPEPYYPADTSNTTTPGQPGPNPPRLVIHKPASGNPALYFVGTPADMATFASNVTTGSTIQIAEFNLLLSISSVGGSDVTIPNTSTQGRLLTMTTPTLLPQMGITTHYQTISFIVHRPAQPLMGEPMLQVPSGMIIDFAAGRSVANIKADQTVDVLFSANGDVMNNSSGMTILWLRKDIPSASYSAANNGGGLAVVYTRTGAVATHPINTSTPPTTNPYLYAQDGINTGF